MNVLRSRARFVVRWGGLGFALFTAGQAYFFLVRENPGVLGPTAAWFSVGLNVATVTVLATFYLLNFVAADRWGWNTRRLYVGSVVCVFASLLLATLGHIHLAGSASTVLPILFVAYALLSSWLLGFRYGWMFFGGSIALWLALFALTKAGALTYMPLAAQRDPVLEKIFLEPRYLAVNVIMYVSIGAGLLWMLNCLQRRVCRQNEELKRVHNELRALATTDPLTGLLNRRSAFEELEGMLAAAAAEHRFVMVAALDLDHFKRVNDTHGHPVGDRALRMVARALADNTRDDDIVARVGGEEFLVASFGTGVSEGAHLLDRVRRGIERTAFTLPEGGRTHVTASIGFVVFDPASPLSLTKLLSRADHALYESKNAGRNRVTYHENPFEVLAPAPAALPPPIAIGESTPRVS